MWTGVAPEAIWMLGDPGGSLVIACISLLSIWYLVTKRKGLILSLRPDSDLFFPFKLSGFIPSPSIV